MACKAINIIANRKGKVLTFPQVVSHRCRLFALMKLSTHLDGWWQEYLLASIQPAFESFFVVYVCVHSQNGRQIRLGRRNKTIGIKGLHYLAILASSLMAHLSKK